VTFYRRELTSEKFEQAADVALMHQRIEILYAISEILNSQLYSDFLWEQADF